MTKARVELIDGKPALVDPDAMAVVRAVAKHNCHKTLLMQAERLRYFVMRTAVRGDSPEDIVVVCLNVDDGHGGALAEALMPGHDWRAIQARGETPFARGIAGREGIQEALSVFDADAADKLKRFAGLAIVVVDFGVADVFSPSAVE